jgi:hypothetical protein
MNAPRANRDQFPGLESETGWSPYLSLQDAQKLDEVREALRQGDLQRAGQLARIYQLTPLQV